MDNSKTIFSALLLAATIAYCCATSVAVVDDEAANNSELNECIRKMEDFIEANPKPEKIAKAARHAINGYPQYKSETFSNLFLIDYVKDQLNNYLSELDRTDRESLKRVASEYLEKFAQLSREFPTGHCGGHEFSELTDIRSDKNTAFLVVHARIDFFLGYIELSRLIVQAKIETASHRYKYYSLLG